MANKFIFDVDGTLTPSRDIIDKSFAVWFSRFCETNDVYLVTGSDRPKTIEQVGQVIYHRSKKVYNCSGNDVYVGDLNLKRNNWKLPSNAEKWLLDILEKSQFPIRTGTHLEYRPGMVNFSIVGRNANKEQRAEYIKWDKIQNERNEIAKEFNHLFTEIEARPGGETGIDISQKGMNKSQIITDFKKTDKLFFFGDRMDEDGNDFPLAEAVYERGGTCYPVEGWQDTWSILRENFTNRQ